MASENPAAKPQIQFKGSCACQRITFDCTELPYSVQACHCISCHKLSGGPYQVFAGVHMASVTYYDHQESLRYEGLPRESLGGIQHLTLSDAAQRAYCVSCHTPLAMRYRNRMETMWICLGSVDEASLGGEEVRKALEVQQHIFVSQKVWWCRIDGDGVPRFERFEGSFEEDVAFPKEKAG